MTAPIFLLCLLTPFTLAVELPVDTRGCYVVWDNVAVYTGTQSWDRYRVTCQQWRLHGEFVYHNFCRDFDGVGTPYCFTSADRMSECDVPNCAFIRPAPDTSRTWSNGSSNLSLKKQPGQTNHLDDRQQNTGKTSGDLFSVEVTTDSPEFSFVPPSQDRHNSEPDAATDGLASTAGTTSEHGQEAGRAAVEKGQGRGKQNTVKPQADTRVEEGGNQPDAKASVYLTWVIVGVSVGLVLAVALAALFVFFFCNDKKREQRSASDPPFPILSIETIAADVGRPEVTSDYTPMPRSPTARR